MDSYPVDPHRALPTAAYRAPALEVDVARVWRDSWVFVATADEVAEPGDFVTTEIGGQPVIVLRRQNGELAALSNLCAHRGTLLADGHGNTKRFQCPYHAWTFAGDGRLLAAPYATREDVDRDQHHLPSYRVEEWHGLVFASLNTELPTVAERLQHLDTIASELGLGELHHWTAHREEEVWEANWKLVIANAMESYHLFRVHEETLEPYSPTAGAYYVAGNADGTATGGRSMRGDSDDDYTLFSLPPNFVGAVTGGSLIWQAVQPISFDRTRVVTGSAHPQRPPEQSRGLSRLVASAASALDMTPDFLPEDREICRRGQVAATGDFEPGTLVPMEQVVSDFHHFLNRQIHGADVPPVRTSAEVGVPRSDRAPTR